MRVFLDTCVLMSDLQRNIVEGLARANVIDIVTSNSVLAEWEHVLTRKNLPERLGDILIFRTQNYVEIVEGERKAIWLADDEDVHVLEGAITARADTLLTDNLRDFPRSATQEYDIIPISLDGLLHQLWPQHDTIIQEVIIRALKGAPQKSTLKRARLYRTAKLMEMTKK